MATGNAGKGTPIYKKDYTPLAANGTLREDLAHLRRLRLIEMGSRSRGARYWFWREKEE